MKILTCTILLGMFTFYSTAYPQITVKQKHYTPNLSSEVEGLIGINDKHPTKNELRDFFVKYAISNNLPIIKFSLSRTAYNGPNGYIPEKRLGYGYIDRQYGLHYAPSDGDSNSLDRISLGYDKERSAIRDAAESGPKHFMEQRVGRSPSGDQPMSRQIRERQNQLKQRLGM